MYIREHISPLDISKWFNRSFAWFLKVAADLCNLFITEVLKLLFLWGCVFTRAFDELNIFKRCLFIEQLVFIVFPDFNRLKMSW